MEFIRGLELKLKDVNLILELAQQKGYIWGNNTFFKCENFKFDKEINSFEFYSSSELNLTVKLDSNKFIAFIFLSFNTTFLYFLGFLLGLTIFSLYPLAVARANDVVDENKDIVEISRTLLFMYSIGSFSSPLLIGFGLSLSTYFLFGSFALLGAFLYFYSLSKERIADDHLSTFVNMPVASGAELPELDPRQKES